MAKLTERQKFFLKNLARGLIFLGIIIAVFLSVKKTVEPEKLSWLKPIAEKPGLIYSIFTLSEIFFGILPPEIFMIWGLRDGIVLDYMKIVSLLFFISYLSGVLGFLFGKFLNSTIIFRWVRIRFLGKHLKKFNEYGVFMIIVAATTPLPFSGICMIVGASNYPLKRFLMYASTRVIRFTVYAWIIWEVNSF